MSAARPTRRTCPRGFTLIELVVTLTLVSVLALVAVPLYEVTMTHAKETELRTALRQMRDALDAYKYAADNGYIAKGAADSGFPPSLRTLVEGVDTIMTPVGNSPPGTPAGVSGNGAPGMAQPGGPGASFSGPAGGGFGSADPAAPGASGKAQGAGANGGANPNGSAASIPTHMVFLRQVPRDPFFEDQSVPPEQQWNLRSYGAMPGDFSGGPDVYDVSSKATGVGMNGIAYKDW